MAFGLSAEEEEEEELLEDLTFLRSRGPR